MYNFSRSVCTNCAAAVHYFLYMEVPWVLHGCPRVSTLAASVPRNNDRFSSDPAVCTIYVEFLRGPPPKYTPKIGIFWVFPGLPASLLFCSQTTLQQVFCSQTTPVLFTNHVIAPILLTHHVTAPIFIHKSRYCSYFVRKSRYKSCFVHKARYTNHFVHTPHLF